MPDSVNSLLPRVFALFGTYINTAAGIIATWLTVHVHLLATFHIGQDQTAKAVAQLVVFGLAYVGSWLGQRAWVKGHHIELAAARGAFVEAGKTVNITNTTPLGPND